MLFLFYNVCDRGVICSYAAVVQNWSNGVSQKMVLQTKGMSKQYCVVISFLVGFLNHFSSKLIEKYFCYRQSIVFSVEYNSKSVNVGIIICL